MNLIIFSICAFIGGFLGSIVLDLVSSNRLKIEKAQLKQLKELKQYLPDDVYYPRLKELGGEVE